MDAVARRAGAGKAAIDRRWPSKPAMVAQFIEEVGAELVAAPDTGSLRGDVAAFLAATAALQRHPLASRTSPTSTPRWRATASSPAPSRPACRSAAASAAPRCCAGPSRAASSRRTSTWIWRSMSCPDRSTGARQAGRPSRCAARATGRYEVLDARNVFGLSSTTASDRRNEWVWASSQARNETSARPTSGPVQRAIIARRRGRLRLMCQRKR
jgi:AcrR family transcriptional regulator